MPRAAAIAGILFSILLIASLALIRISVPANPQDIGAWLSGGWRNVNLALNMLPFAGIAFLWFIGVVRDRLGQNEDRFNLHPLAAHRDNPALDGFPGPGAGALSAPEHWLLLLGSTGLSAVGAPDQHLHPPGEFTEI
jgi:hypothetical protein